MIKEEGFKFIPLYQIIIRVVWFFEVSKNYAMLYFTFK